MDSPRISAHPEILLKSSIADRTDKERITAFQSRAHLTDKYLKELLSGRTSRWLIINYTKEPFFAMKRTIRTGKE